MRIILAVVFICLCSPAFAATLKSVDTEPNGWYFYFDVKSHGSTTNLRVPMNKCFSIRPEANCYTTKADATKAARAKAKKTEEALK